MNGCIGEGGVFSLVMGAGAGAGAGAVTAAVVSPCSRPVLQLCT